MSIRRAHSTDAAAIAALARALALHVCDPDPGEDTMSLVATCLSSDPWCECLVAEIEREVVGYASFSRRYDPHTRERSLWLSDLVVALNCRGLGVGHALVRALSARAADLGAGSVCFEVWNENASALRFYDRIGAEVISDRLLLRLPVGGRTGSAPGRDARET
jgi:ribosomal protein S18 acetylase RimI-like enzyme